MEVFGCFLWTFLLISTAFFQTGFICAVSLDFFRLPWRFQSPLLSSPLPAFLLNSHQLRYTRTCKALLIIGLYLFSTPFRQHGGIQHSDKMDLCNFGFFLFFFLAYTPPGLVFYLYSELATGTIPGVQTFDGYALTFVFYFFLACSVVFIIIYPYSTW